MHAVVKVRFVERLWTLGLFAIDGPAEVRPFTWVPLEGSWWEYLVFGITASTLGSLSMALLFGPIAAAGLILPWKLVSRHVLARPTTLWRVSTSAIGVFLGISTVSAMALMMVMWKQGGELVGPQGSLFQSGNYGFPAVGNTYYFSALAVLGAGFGEYEPTGLCRPVVLATVVLGKMLEVAVIATGVSFATASFGGSARDASADRQ